MSGTDVGRNAGGLDDPERQRAGYRGVWRVLERFRASELSRRMEAAEIILREVPYHLEGDDGGLQSGAIDALFKEGERWVLVEFKTDQIKAGEEIDWEVLDYHDQVQGYLDASERLLGSRPDPILCFLDLGGRIKEVTDRWG